MEALRLRRTCSRLTQELVNWKIGAIGLLLLSVLVNAALFVAIQEYHAQLDAQASQLRQAERTRDLAVQELGAMALRAEEERQAREAQAAASAALEGWQYIGECTITAYCPCEACCAPYADGLTATGIPAGPGVVAVDPAVIPLGSTVIINGQAYLAADTGGAVKGLHVDVCVSSHKEAAAFGVQEAAVWVMGAPDE